MTDPDSHPARSDFERSERALVMDGMFAQAMASLVGGAFLAAFALALGADAFLVGVVAGLPAAGQLLQVPGVLLIRWVGRRKPVALAAAIASRLAWLAVAAVPLVLDGTPAFMAVSLGVFLASGLGSVGGVAWLSWMRDLVPEDVMGRFFSRRMRLANVLAIAASLVAGFFVEWWNEAGRDAPLAFTVVFGAAALLGFVGTVALSRAREPRGPDLGEPDPDSLIEAFRKPFRDRNFRRLIFFSAAWTFTLTSVGPFFVVYLLDRIGLTMGTVILLTVVSQLFVVLFLPFWGRMTDRFSNRSVLAASGTILLLAILGWPFTTMPTPHVLTLPLLAGLHVAMGLAMGGIMLATGNMGLKLSPPGRAEAYVTSLGVVNSSVAAVSPVLAGGLAAFFTGKEAALTLRLRDAERIVSVPTISLQGLDFLFLLAVLAGVYAMHRLAFVHEEGTVEESVVLDELREEILEGVRTVASFAGVRQVVSFPGYVVSRKARVEWRKGRGTPEDE